MGFCVRKKRKIPEREIREGTNKGRREKWKERKGEGGNPNGTS